MGITGPALRTANTSHVERHNLSMCIGIRRLTRLANAFSLKLEEHRAMLAPYLYVYDWIKRHGALRTKSNIRITPAMAACITDRPATLRNWSL